MGAPTGDQPRRGGARGGAFARGCVCARVCSGRARRGWLPPSLLLRPRLQRRGRPTPASTACSVRGRSSGWAERALTGERRACTRPGQVAATPACEGGGNARRDVPRGLPPDDRRGALGGGVCASDFAPRWHAVRGRASSPLAGALGWLAQGPHGSAGSRNMVGRLTGSARGYRCCVGGRLLP